MGFNNLPQQKFRVSAVLTVLGVFFVSLGCFVSVSWYFIDTRVGGNETGSLAIDIILILFVIIGVCLCIFLIIKCWSIIVLDEKGISRFLFGKLRQHIAWEELTHIKIKGNMMASWIHFSKQSMIDDKVKKSKIALTLSEDFIQSLEFYYGIDTSRKGRHAVEIGKNDTYLLRPLTPEERTKRLEEVRATKEEASKYIATEEGYLIPNPNYKVFETTTTSSENATTPTDDTTTD